MHQPQNQNKLFLIAPCRTKNNYFYYLLLNREEESKKDENEEKTISPEVEVKQVKEFNEI